MTVVASAEAVEKVHGHGLAAVHAVRGVSLDLFAGEAVVLLGPSGSGKSTLLHLLAALDTPTAGRILLLGRDLAALDDDERSAVRRRDVGCLLQGMHLLPALTVLENVLVSLLPGAIGPEVRGRARSLLERLGLAPNIAGRRPGALSGGEARRVALARALLGRPRLILADEPTADLDGATGRAVVAALRERALEDRAAVVVTTHDERLIEPGDRVVRLRDGLITSVEAGSRGGT